MYDCRYMPRRYLYVCVLLEWCGMTVYGACVVGVVTSDVMEIICESWFENLSVSGSGQEVHRVV